MVISRDDVTRNRSALEGSQVRVERLSRVFAVLGLVFVAAVAVPADLIGRTLASGPERYLVSSAALVAVFTPLILVFLRLAKKQQEAVGQTMASIERELTDALDRAEDEGRRRESQVRRQDFESRLANALEMAEGETEVIDVVVRAFCSTLPETPVELLLADNSHAHLSRMASSPPGQPPMCSVDSPDHCPAARRAQTQRFADSDAIDACPKLRDRDEGRCSALCVPVSIMGRTVGVIHTTSEPGAGPSDIVMQDLGILANLAGARIGLLRMVAETQIQASTDSLTGLLNRRSLENQVKTLREAGTPFAVVMADLDHFKRLNDTHGHETGDRALRLFAQTLKTTLRGQDLVSRHGGEEFAIVLPRCTAADAERAIHSVRDTLQTALRSAGLPALTASFGVVPSKDDEDLTSSLGRADVALFQAKHEGRNRIVVHDDMIDSVVTDIATRTRGESDTTAETQRESSERVERPAST